MTQITGFISPKAYKIETSPDGSTWTDRSGATVAIEMNERTRISGEEYTFDGDTAAITSGPLEPLEVTHKFLYTEGASDLFDDVEAVQTANTAWYIRWTPKGGTTGDFKYTSGAGIVTGLMYPLGAKSDGKPVVCQYTLKFAALTKAATP